MPTRQSKLVLGTILAAFLLFAMVAALPMVPRSYAATTNLYSISLNNTLNAEAANVGATMQIEILNGTTTTVALAATSLNSTGGYLFSGVDNGSAYQVEILWQGLKVWDVNTTSITTTSVTLSQITTAVYQNAASSGYDIGAALPANVTSVGWAQDTLSANLAVKSTAFTLKEIASSAPVVEQTSAGTPTWSFSSGVLTLTATPQTGTSTASVTLDYATGVAPHTTTQSQPSQQSNSPKGSQLASYFSNPMILSIIVAVPVALGVGLWLTMNGSASRRGRGRR